MRSVKSQAGFLLIVAVVLIMVVALMATAMLTLTAGSGQSGGVHVLSTQALYVAETGLEYEQRRLAQNVDWYRATTDPFDQATRSAGQGSFTVLVNLPATELSRRMTTAAAPLTITVFGGGAANRWPATGTLLIDDFTGTPEFVTYSSTTATTFVVNARNAAVNAVQGTLTTHSRGDVVYPVATLSVALVANCATIPTPFNISNNSKFLDAGTITVFHDNAGTIVSEQITYTGSTIVGATRTLLGVQRCQNDLTPVAIVAAAGDPVAPMVANVGTESFEVYVSSSATVGNAARTWRKTVQR